MPLPSQKNLAGRTRLGPTKRTRIQKKKNREGKQISSGRSVYWPSTQNPTPDKDRDDGSLPASSRRLGTRSPPLIARSPRSVWRNLASWARSHRADRRGGNDDSAGSRSPPPAPLRSLRTATPGHTLSSLSLSSSLSFSSLSSSSSSLSPASSPSSISINGQSPPPSPLASRASLAAWSHASISLSARARHAHTDSFASSGLSSALSLSSLSSASSRTSSTTSGSASSTPTVSPSSSSIYVAQARVVDAPIPLWHSKRLFWAQCIKFVIKDANANLDVTVVAVHPLDVDLFWLYEMAHVLYDAVRPRRGDGASEEPRVYHDCATGGFFCIDNAEALIAAQRRWTIHTLSIPAAERRCMRYRIVGADLS
nr:hypothetical protein [Pandoravirus massiliensis]